MVRKREDCQLLGEVTSCLFFVDNALTQGFRNSLDFGPNSRKICHNSRKSFHNSEIGERDNSVYGLRAGSQVWKGENGKAKTQ